MNATAQPSTSPKRRQVVPSGVLGMVIFTVTEMMFFLAFISAFLIVKARSSVWPPLDQPRLPVEMTAFNTVLLLISGVLLFKGARAFSKEGANCKPLILGAVVFASAFVLLQGYEWLSLITAGLTLTSSSLGSFFYTIVGLHALHALIAIGMLVYIYRQLLIGTLTESALWTTEVFWYFVVCVWPILYWQVYLA
jgi:heme/copper-type cytochrome/quinol oxidase subunit 3